MKFLYLITMFFSFSCLAIDLSYRSYDMSATPMKLAEVHKQEFQDNGFHALADASHGIPSMGINQVYFKTETQFVLVKYGIEGSVPLDQIIPTPTGFMVHKKDQNQIYMMYFRGFQLAYVHQMLNRLNQKVSNFKMLKNILIPSAEASECDTAFGQPILNQSGQLSRISAAVAWESLKSCMTGVGQGVVDNTVGVVKGVASELGDFITHPINYVEAVANKVELFLVKTAQFIKQLVTEPEKAFESIGRGLGKTWESVKRTVTSMSTEMKINFVCSFIGSLGVDAALAFLTGGAASEKVMLTIGNLSRKFGMIEKMMSILSKLNSTLLSKFHLQGEKLEKFMKGIFNNHIPEEDLMHLDDIAHMSDELSLRTLSCYIH